MLKSANVMQKWISKLALTADWQINFVVFVGPQEYIDAASWHFELTLVK